MKIIGYLTSGYPSIERSIEVAREYVEAGCNMLEISIPLENNREKPFLNDVMKKAYYLCSDYNEHLKAIQEIARIMPDIPITVLIYDEMIDAIGIDKFADALLEVGIHDINSANLTDEESISYLEKRGIYLAGLVNYELIPWRIEQAKKTKGFVYCQAYPRKGQTLVRDVDSIEKLIPWLRNAGVLGKIYCGGGISTPLDALRVVKAGADGFFLGSSIISLSEEPQKLHQTIKEFADIVENV